MFRNVVPVTKARHAKTKIKPTQSFAFAKDLHLAYVTSQEFVRAASAYPIVFIEDNTAKDSGFRPVALLGLEAGVNLFVDQEGAWKTGYVPAILRRYPFALTRAQDSEDFLVCLDEGSDLVNEDDGAALFDEKGEPTEVVENVKRYLAELQQLDRLTEQFCHELSSRNLLTPLNMRVGEANAMRNITGCYIINEQRLNSLPMETFQELREKQFLPQIYAHLISLGQMERLVKLNAEKSGKIEEAPSADAEPAAAETESEPQVH